MTDEFLSKLRVEMLHLALQLNPNSYPGALTQRAEALVNYVLTGSIIRTPNNG